MAAVARPRISNHFLPHLGIVPFLLLIPVPTICSSHQVTVSYIQLVGIVAVAYEIAPEERFALLRPKPVSRGNGNVSDHIFRVNLLLFD